MDAYRIYILNKAYRYYCTFRIPQQYQFQLFPSCQRFFYQDLMNLTGLQTAGTKGTKRWFIFRNAASAAATSVRRLEHDRVSYFFCCRSGFFRTGTGYAAGSRKA